MRKQKITRPELAPWPQAKANIGNVVGAKIADDTIDVKTTPTQISAICAAMDKAPAPSPAAYKTEGRKGDYVLPNLPPQGMRWQQPKRTKFKRVLRG
jgi:hypothetical protein